MQILSLQVCCKVFVRVAAGYLCPLATAGLTYAIIGGERVEVAANAGAGIASHGVVAVPDVLTLTIVFTLVALIDI